MSYSLGSRLLAEFVGTFFLVAVGVGSIVAGGDLLTVALAHGLVIAVAVTGVGHVSGGHFNPAISATLVLLRRQAPVDGIAYIVVQMVAAWVAMAFLALGWNLTAGELEVGAAVLAKDIDMGAGILLEVVATFLLVWTVFAVAVDFDGAFQKVAGLPIGLSITAGILMTGPATGAALNPAKWFGPALYTGTWDDALVWIAGPLVGAVLAGVAYMYGIRPRLENVAASQAD